MDQPTPQANHTTQSYRKPKGGNRGLSQAYIMRDLAARQLVALETLTANDVKEHAAKAGAIRDMAAVWSVATERIRILRGRPLPGSLKPLSPRKRKKPHTGPLFLDPSALPADTPETQQ